MLPKTLRFTLCVHGHQNISGQSIYLKFESCSSVGYSGGPTALTAKLNCSHCRSTSLQPKLNWGGLTALTAKLDCTHCRSTSLQPKFNWGRGLTAVTAELNCSHCRSTSLQAKFNWGGV